MKTNVELTLLAGRERDLGGGKRPHARAGILDAQSIRSRLQTAEHVGARRFADGAAVDPLRVGEDDGGVSDRPAFRTDHRSLQRGPRCLRSGHRHARLQGNADRERLPANDRDLILAERRKRLIVGPQAIHAGLQSAEHELPIRVAYRAPVDALRVGDDDRDIRLRGSCGSHDDAVDGPAALRLQIRDGRQQRQQQCGQAWHAALKRCATPLEDVRVTKPPR